MLKSSAKSVEGQSVYAVVIGAMVILYNLLVGGDSSGVPVDDILKHAQTAKDIIEAYKLENIGGGWDTAKVIAILTFVYKIFGRFTDSRTSLKKKELEVNNVEQINSVG
jgi:hypothetical protein